jgi:hypothetical protein
MYYDDFEPIGNPNVWRIRDKLSPSPLPPSGISGFAAFFTGSRDQNPSYTPLLTLEKTEGAIKKR